MPHSYGVAFAFAVSFSHLHASDPECQSAMSDMGVRGPFIMLAAVVCWTILAVEGMIDHFCLCVKCEMGEIVSSSWLPGRES